MDKNKRFWCLEEYVGETSPIVDGKFAPTNGWLCNKLNELNELAEANEEQCLKIMTYLHDNYYDIWEEVNNECFRRDLE